MPSLSTQAAIALVDGQSFELKDTLPDESQLWVNPEDFSRINGFVLKAEGACCGEVCIAISRLTSSGLIVQRDGQTWLNASGFAPLVQQSFVVDHDSDVWSFGMVPASRKPFFEAAIAPDFCLTDRHGDKVRLSDFRGKKVLLVTWASWCGCRLDVQVWQTIYEQINSEDFVIISAAQDTGGEAAAGKIYDDANVTYVAVIDEDHTISTLYNFVNVPSGAWIDEQGTIVRIDEGNYGQRHSLGSISFGSEDYVPALRDWIAHGAESKFAQAPGVVSSSITARSSDAERAEPAFKIGAYFHRQGQAEKARLWWAESQKLNPDSWNFHRQDWSFHPEEALLKWRQKVHALGDKPYYRPLELP